VLVLTKPEVFTGKTDTGAIDLANLSGDSKYAIDYLGDKNANTLTGTHLVEPKVQLWHQCWHHYEYKHHK
jgi:hypothetical protein